MMNVVGDEVQKVRKIFNEKYLTKFTLVCIMGIYKYTNDKMQ